MVLRVYIYLLLTKIKNIKKKLFVQNNKKLNKVIVHAIM